MGKTRHVTTRRIPQVEECSPFFYRVLAQVDGKMVKPTPERPLEGIITVHSEISPMASSDYEPGRYVL